MKKIVAFFASYFIFPEQYNSHPEAQESKFLNEEASCPLLSGGVSQLLVYNDDLVMMQLLYSFLEFSRIWSFCVCACVHAHVHAHVCKNPAEFHCGFHEPVLTTVPFSSSHSSLVHYLIITYFPISRISKASVPNLGQCLVLWMQRFFLSSFTSPWTIPWSSCDTHAWRIRFLPCKSLQSCFLGHFQSSPFLKLIFYKVPNLGILIFHHIWNQKQST